MREKSWPEEKVSHFSVSRQKMTEETKERKGRREKKWFQVPSFEVHLAKDVHDFSRPEKIACTNSFKRSINLNLPHDCLLYKIREKEAWMEDKYDDSRSQCW